MQEVKICIATHPRIRPSNNHLHSMTALREYYPSVHYNHGSFLPVSRNSLLSSSQSITQSQFEYEKYFFIDDDIGFSIHAFEAVLQLCTPEKKIVLGAYTLKNKNYLYDCGYWGTPGQIHTRLSRQEQGLKSVDFVASGFTCIHYTALQEMPFPWFRCPVITLGGSAAIVGEDIGFCMQADKFKIDRYALLGLELKHELK